MPSAHSDELVFTVSGATAHPIARTAIESLGLTERSHLQEWVIAHPDIIAPDVLIITFEFDRWSAASGSNPRDRLDVLGLDTTGRLVVAELKRGRAPDTVELQAIKYAAMASRFSPDQLAELHVEFVQRAQSVNLTEAEALEKLQTHVVPGLSAELLAQPKIVLLAEEFSPTVTSSCVWLNEQGVDITLRRYQAYSTSAGEIIVTVSQYYPVREIASFEVTPRSRPRIVRMVDELLEAPWTAQDFQLLESLPFEVPHAILDLCSNRPNEWIAAAEAYSHADIERRTGAQKIAAFAMSVYTRFHRRNPPWATRWGEGGDNQRYYRVDPETADSWIRARESSGRRDAFPEPGSATIRS